MEVRSLGQGIYAFLGAVNLGAIVSEGLALFVDAVLDEGPAQIGVRVGHVLFCADALFPPAILAKHPIPFCYDLHQALSSLAVVEGSQLLWRRR